MQGKYDAIVAGCGPAGAIAGTVLARQGLNVAMVDRAVFPRKKLCGGLLTWKSMQLLESVLGETADSLTEKGGINWRSSNYVIRSLDRELAAGTLDYPFHFVDRAAFDTLLLEHARQAGAEIIQGVRITGCDVEAGTVELEDGTTLKAEIIIAADGVNSRLRRAFGQQIDRKRWKQNLAPALEILIPHNEFPRKVEHPELIVGHLEAGYGWVFPSRESVVVGICGLNLNNDNFGHLFRDYLAHLGLDPDEVGDYRGHPLPYGNWVTEPCKGRALLAGDAGGFVEPLFGEGIFFALCTGLYAGQSAADFLAHSADPGAAYHQKLEAMILPELKASNTLRWKLFKAMSSLGTGSLGLFVRLGAPWLTQMVHGKRSYRFLRRKNWAF